MTDTDVPNAPRYDDLPAKMRQLPVDERGYPVPWFVAWDGDPLRPVFPAMDGAKLHRAWQKRLCWVCGKDLGRIGAFVIGPMCAVNRISSEPPSHPECARFSAIHCPFLSRPKMKRQTDAFYDQRGVVKGGAAGIMEPRNPGVGLVWSSLRWSRFSDGKGGYLFDIGQPHAVAWYAEGREATRAEVLASINSGLPTLQRLCDEEADPVDRRRARYQLDEAVEKAMMLLPKAA